MQYPGFIIVLICILASAAISRRIQDTILTLPMVFTFLGIIIGSQILGLINIGLDNEFLRITAELTLVMVLASDASRINVRMLMKDHNLPVRLLGVGLPLTMLLGALVAYVMFGELGFWGAVVLAILLAPTDAGLGQAVITSKRVPVRIRQTLNIESGLNDGIVMPFLVMAISLAVATDEAQPVDRFIVSALLYIMLGIGAGVFVGLLGARFVQWGQRSGWMSEEFRKISALALILLSYGVAELIGGNGFIAAFVMGVMAGFKARNQNQDIQEYLEVEVSLLMLLTFLLFGAVLLPLAVDGITVWTVLYAIISLTLIRMIPVAISLIGSGLSAKTVGFIGWFGPRGIASILYIFTVLEAEDLFGKELIYDVAMITVFLSIILHGITAAPGARWYGRQMIDRQLTHPDTPETMEVSEMPLRSHGLKSS